MIFDTLSNFNRYIDLHVLFPRVAQYLRETDLAALTPGRHSIAGEQLFVIVEALAGRSRDAAKLECHRKYIDIQLVLEGTDEMGWKPVPACTKPIGAFNAEQDSQFFHDTPDSWIATPPGAFCIFFPEDAHAPLVSSGNIRKAIFKIALSPC
ncbi:MAG TPA: YhcH/YjgK/YiaL family protein [Gallionella sp.]|nr:YhcH/YjgK/YiaL family protein [Gallionella sp.]